MTTTSAILFGVTLLQAIYALRSSTEPGWTYIHAVLASVSVTLALILK